MEVIRWESTLKNRREEKMGKRTGQTDSSLLEQQQQQQPQRDRISMHERNTAMELGHNAALDPLVGI